MSDTWRLVLRWAPLALAGVAFAVLYRNVAVELIRAWSTDDNYSHGFLIVPVAAYLTWERRARLSAEPLRPAPIGLAVVLASLAMLVIGTLGAELFLTRVSMVGVVAGGILFLCGWAWLRVMAFPVAFLLLMIPLPAIVFNQIAFPLQLLASQAGAAAVSALGIPVLREGNLIVLSYTTLEVAEACSGIRSLVSLITLGVLYGYFIDPRMSVRLALLVSTIPVAILANAIRVAGTGIAAEYLGAESAEGFFHGFSGWAVFLVACTALIGIHHLLLTSMRISARLRMRTA
jgi:exosortase